MRPIFIVCNVLVNLAVLGLLVALVALPDRAAATYAALAGASVLALAYLVCAVAFLLYALRIGRLLSKASAVKASRSSTVTAKKPNSSKSSASLTRKSDARCSLVTRTYAVGVSISVFFMLAAVV